MQAVFQVARSGLVVLGFVWPWCAHATDATDWLHRAASAAQRLNYVGTILYQHGTRIETSRIVHYVDPTGEYEKLVNLDGPPREVIRNNEQVTCYLPDSKLVRIENRASRSVFPSLLPNQIATLAQNYIMRQAEPARVAGHDAQAFVLEPRDGMRYGHVFWTDAATGLLLKTRMFDENNRVVEMSAFLEVQINARVDRSMVQPSYPAQPADWLVGDQVAVGLQQDCRRLPDAARPHRTGRAYCLYRRAGRSFRFRRSHAGNAASARFVTAGRNQYLQASARRIFGNRFGRDAGRHREADRQFRNAQVATRGWNP
jgi:hypothetical protein